MTDQMTEEERQKLCADLRRDGAFMDITNKQLRAAADEIERLASIVRDYEHRDAELRINTEEDDISRMTERAR